MSYATYTTPAPPTQSNAIIPPSTESASRSRRTRGTGPPGPYADRWPCIPDCPGGIADSTYRGYRPARPDPTTTDVHLRNHNGSIANYA
ncbi:hypothetical protein GCM10009779_39160 [Polymorphospora rubra]